ncbi:MAG: hypothetical protein ACYC3I_24890 [Gemmataceae bacterium]
MTTLTHASRELFTRAEDERYESLPELRRVTTQEKGRFSVWSIVEAFTQLSHEYTFACSRSEAGAKAARLLTLVTK